MPRRLQQKCFTINFGILPASPLFWLRAEGVAQTLAAWLGRSFQQCGLTQAAGYPSRALPQAFPVPLVPRVLRVLLVCLRSLGGAGALVLENGTDGARAMGVSGAPMWGCLGCGQRRACTGRSGCQGCGGCLGWARHLEGVDRRVTRGRCCRWRGRVSDLGISVCLLHLNGLPQE